MTENRVKKYLKSPIEEECKAFAESLYGEDDTRGVCFIVFKKAPDEITADFESHVFCKDESTQQLLDALHGDMTDSLRTCLDEANRKCEMFGDMFKALHDIKKKIEGEEE